MPCFELVTASFTDRLFVSAIILSASFFVVFFLGILISMVQYTDLKTMIMTILSQEILFAIKLSLVTATVAVILSSVISIPAAYMISRMNFPSKNIIDTLLDIPLVMPPIALGAALLMFFSTPVGSVIQSTTIKFVFQQPGIVLAQFTVISSIYIRLMKSTFDNIDPMYEKVARTLRCNRFQAFIKTTLPLARNGLFAAIILSWARAVGEFGASVTIAGATRMKTETLPIAIYLNLATANIEKTVAIVFILAVISIVVLLSIRKFSTKAPLG
jgi:molybdate transport system permease protein